MIVAIYSGEIPSTTFIERLVRGLADNGQKLRLYGSQRGAVSYPKNVECFVSPTGKLSKLLFALIVQLKLRIMHKADYKKLKKHISQTTESARERYNAWVKFGPVILNPPDIFHIQWAKSVSEWMFVQELFGIKVVLSLRGAHINYSPLADSNLAEQYRLQFPKIQAFHAVSQDIAINASKYGANPENTAVIYSGLDLHKLQHFKKDDYSLKPVLKVLSVGRFHWKKGYHYALDAMNAMKSSEFKISYQIVAGVPDEEILYQLTELELNDVVEIMPRQTETMVYELMKNADCLLLPSVEEGVANVVLEAMAIGLPVLSSACGGMEEVIEHNKSGILFPTRSAMAIEQSLSLFYKKSEVDRKALALNAFERIDKEHHQKQMIQEMQELYMKVS